MNKVCTERGCRSGLLVDNDYCEKHFNYHYPTRKKWLDSRGGRIESDVKEDKGGEYVIMTDGGADKKVYLPKKFKKE
jgi:hypothetical protein